MLKRKELNFLLVIVIITGLYFLYINSRVMYSITEDNVKSIYCEYYLEGTRIVPVDENDKKIIISEVSKLREAKNNGEVGTVPYKFVMELTNGNKVEFIQNTSDVIEIYSNIDNQQRKIKAPKTAEFIKRFIKENNFVL